MGAWINPKQLTKVAEISKRSNSSVYVEQTGGGVRITPGRGTKQVFVNYYGKIIDEEES